MKRDKGSDGLLTMDHEISPTLRLVSPSTLHKTVVLTSDQREEIAEILSQFLAALEKTSPTESLRLIEPLVRRSNGDTQSITAAENPFPLAFEDIQDYDNYFCVSHVKSTNQAEILLGSLVTSCLEFLDYCVQKPTTNAQLIAALIQGFRSQANLLNRMFHLEDSP